VSQGGMRVAEAAAYNTFVPMAGFPSSECQMRLVTTTAMSGHGPVIADVDVACIHEHVTKNLPCCADCLEQHVADPLCCGMCELVLGPFPSSAHCCPVILNVRVR
jgi:hypothetical protein